MPASPAADRMTCVPLVERIRADRDRLGLAVSFEFFPPANDQQETMLWRSLRRLEGLQPTFVSVTYGAGGTNQERTVGTTEQIACDTILTPVGHLTCVGQTRDELRHVIGRYAAAGVTDILALRGDPSGGPGTSWVPIPDGLDHADELVALVRELGDFSVGVAAYARGHREAVSLEADADVLVAKQEAGATFAVTDFFFRADDFRALVQRARDRGCTMPILPGIMPITAIGQVARFAELSGHAVPPEVVARVEGLDPDGVRAEGVQIATELCQELIADGVDGLHFYTLNRSTATLEIARNLGLGG